MAEKGKKRLCAPILLGPWIATCEINSQCSPSSTSGPITQYGPIEHDAGTFAAGSMIAVGWGCGIDGYSADSVSAAGEPDLAGRSMMAQLIVASATSFPSTKTCP